MDIFIPIVTHILSIISGAILPLIILYVKGFWKITVDFAVLQNEVKNIDKTQTELKKEIIQIRSDVYKVAIQSTVEKKI